MQRNLHVNAHDLYQISMLPVPDEKVMAGEGRQWLVSCIRDFPWGVTGVIIYFYHKTSCHFQNKYQIASTVEKLKTFMVVKQGKGDTFRINTPPHTYPCVSYSLVTGLEERFHTFFY